MQREKEQFLHVVRLAWDLRMMGADVMIDMAPTDEPSVVVRRESGRLRILAVVRRRRWVFTWGRGRTQCVEALDGSAAWQIKQVQ